MIPIAQTFFHPGIHPLQVIDHLLNSLAFHRNDSLTVRKMPQ
jgi:hypothetical protein